MKEGIGWSEPDLDINSEILQQDLKDDTEIEAIGEDAFDNQTDN